MRKWIYFLIVVIYVFFNGAPLMLAHAEDEDIEYYDDFYNYTVQDFDDYKPIFRETTYNLKGKITTFFEMSYKFDDQTCESYDEPIDAFLTISYKIGSGNYQFLSDIELPDLPCHDFGLGYYYIFIENVALPSTILNNIAMDNNRFVDFRTVFTFKATQFMGTLFQVNYMRFWSIYEYDFGTSYLMSTFLLDSDFIDNGEFEETYNRPFVVYAINSQNDRISIFNTNYWTANDRTKYAIPITNATNGDSVGYVAKTIGNGWESVSDETNTYLLNTQWFNGFKSEWRLYYFNVANMKTPFDDTTIDRTPHYAVCDNVLGFPINCVLNGAPIGSFQAMGNDIWEWITKESPLISDIYSLGSGGLQWLSNSMQFLAQFDSETIIGGVIAMAFGLTLVIFVISGG
jgi:hypothetical protein